MVSSAEGGAGEDGVMSSAEMVALMNNSALLMKSSTGGTLSQTGAGRDADGTIDRSPPPTEEVKVLLKELKRAIDRYGIDMTLEFRTQGATQYGTITKSRFNSILTTTFGLEKNFFWDDAKLNILNVHYGTGASFGMHHDSSRFLPRLLTAFYYLNDVEAGGEVRSTLGHAPEAPTRRGRIASRARGASSMSVNADARAMRARRRMPAA